MPGAHASAWVMDWKLINDIDAAKTKYWNNNEGFSPIGNNTTSFSGSFDGNNFEIKNLVINRVAGTKIGFFGVTDNALISNVALTNCSIEGNTFTGALVGIAGSSTITNCHSSGTVKSGNVGGGLIGQMSSTAVSNSYSSCTINVVMNSGGFIGISENSSSNSIKNCFATGNVNGSSYFGGFVGQHKNGTFTNCYSSGSTSISGTTIGGFTGYMSTGKIVSCYYDLTKTAGSAIGNTSNSELTGLTTEQFEDEDNFTDWDFNAVWHINTIEEIDSVARPYLRWQFESSKTIVFMAGDNGSIDGITPQERFPEEAALPVTAVPESGYHFIEWQSISGSSISTSNPLTLVEFNDGDTIVAVFENANAIHDATIDSKVFPNPANNIVTIETELAVRYILMNSSGMVVRTSVDALSDQQVIDVSDLNSGVYVLQLISGEKLKTIKLVLNN